MLGNKCPVHAAGTPEKWQTELLALREAYLKPSVRTQPLFDKAHAAAYGALADHPLRIYAEFWRLSARLGSGQYDREPVRTFLARYPDARLADQLRREALKVVGKSANWDDFRDLYIAYGGEDAEIACYVWHERLTRQDGEVLTEAKALWNSGQAAPEACDAAFRALFAAGRVSTEEAWLRMRKLLEQGLIGDVKRATPYLPEAARLPERSLTAAHHEPGRFLLREKLNPRSRASLELTLHAVQRYARKDAPDTAGWLEGKGAGLPPDLQRQAWAQVALHAAMQHEPRAVDWFARAEGHPLSDNQAAWRVRAALRTQDWKQVQAAIEAMGPLLRREPAWRYWLGRAHLEQGRKADADLIWNPLSAELNYYGMLAAESLGRLAPPKWETWRPSPAELDAIRGNASLQRSLLLYQAGLPGEGLLEWRWAMRGLDDKQLLAASAVARDAGILDRAMNAADRTVALHDLTQRFPLPFRDALLAAARQQQLDEAWVYGLVRQESAFIADVKSSAGAVGLMQLMPATAKWVARQVNLGKYNAAQLADVETNLQLGTFYLRHVLDDLSDPVLATAAYNAGPGRARRWRAETPLDGTIYAETIPFNETRDYVKRVMANAWLYASRLGAPKRSLKEMMGTVPARTSQRVATTQ